MHACLEQGAELGVMWSRRSDALTCRETRNADRSDSNRASESHSNSVRHPPNQSLNRTFVRFENAERKGMVQLGL